MKRLKQHKAFIYYGDVINTIKREVLDDLCDLYECSGDEVLHKEDVLIYNLSEVDIPETIEEIIKQYRYNPTDIAKVIVLDNADELSVLMQNKLLKPIEDSNMNIKTIIIATKPFIQTIESRSMLINVTSSTEIKFPQNAEELKTFFGIPMGTSDKVYKQVLGLYNAVRSKQSLLIGSELIKEKSPALKLLASKISKIAELIILFEISQTDITSRSKIASKYLEIESNEINLYQMLFELEL